MLFGFKLSIFFIFGLFHGEKMSSFADSIGSFGFQEQVKETNAGHIEYLLICFGIE